MAIDVIETLKKNGYYLSPRDGEKIEIGHFTMHLNINSAIDIGVPLTIICEIASMLHGRVDHNLKNRDKAISSSHMNKILSLETVPKGIAFITVTKKVMGGVSQSFKSKLKDFLMEHNSYGNTIYDNLIGLIESEKGTYVGRKVKVHGMNDFFAVSYIALGIVELHKYNQIDDIDDIPHGEIKDYIIGKLQESSCIGENFDSGVGINVAKI